MFLFCYVGSFRTVRDLVTRYLIKHSFKSVDIASKTRIKYRENERIKSLKSIAPYRLLFYSRTGADDAGLSNFAHVHTEISFFSIIFFFQRNLVKLLNIRKKVGLYHFHKIEKIKNIRRRKLEIFKEFRFNSCTMFAIL